MVERLPSFPSDAPRAGAGSAPRLRRAGRARVALLLALAWWAAVAGATPLRIATYNLGNYGLADRRTEAGFRPDYPKPEAEKAAVRRNVADAALDLLLLQELGGEGFLRELQRDLAAEGRSFPHAFAAAADDADRQLGLLARTPVREVRLLPAPGGLRRGLLEVVTSWEGRELRVYGFHLKSHRTEDPSDPEGQAERLAGAEAVRALVLERAGDPEEAWFVVVGDANDGPASRTLARLTRLGRRTVARRVPAADDRGDTWTLHFAREASYLTYDHVLVSPALEAAAEVRAGIVAEAGSERGSDHRLVWLELRPRPPASSAP